MTEEDINSRIQLLCAFVRPFHGEIWIIKKDGHPSHRSELVVNNLTDGTILNQTSPPYVHEGVGQIENTLQWDILSANTLLIGTLPNASLVLTIFYKHEPCTTAVRTSVLHRRHTGGRNWHI